MAVLSSVYIAKGWQRPWPRYDAASTLWSWRWPSSTVDLASGAQPTAGSTSSSPGVVARVPAADPVPARRLALGYLEPSVAGHENAGLHPLAGIDHVDLSGTWPWPEATFDHVRCTGVLPRLPDKIAAMNELWRITKPGGSVEVTLPSADGPGAFQDPTYVSFWNERSFASALIWSRPHERNLFSQIFLPQHHAADHADAEDIKPA